MMDEKISFQELLNHSYKIISAEDKSLTRHGYLSNWIFNFTTYDNQISDLFGRKALEVCVAITNESTFDYIEDNYKWFLIMINMPFFENKLEWGRSIRGAWWDLYDDKTFEINSSGLYLNNEQLETLTLDENQWKDFITGMYIFVRQVINDNTENNNA